MAVFRENVEFIKQRLRLALGFFGNALCLGLGFFELFVAQGLHLLFELFRLLRIALGFFGKQCRFLGFALKLHAAFFNLFDHFFKAAVLAANEFLGFLNYRIIHSQALRNGKGITSAGNAQH